MIKKIINIVLLFCFLPLLPALGQQWQGVYSLYDFETSREKVQAPKGYKIVYLSHYGRHGARYLNRPEEYRTIVDIFESQAADDNLTATGLLFWNAFTADSTKFIGRAGDLTSLGRQQHQMLGNRYKKRFPHLFRNSSSVRAESSTSPRCISSMYCFLQGAGLSALQSRISDVNSAHMSYLSVPTTSRNHSANAVATAVDITAICGRLFVNPEKLESSEKIQDFIMDLFYFYAGMGCVEMEDWNMIFTEQELVALASLDNRKFHYNCGWDCPENVYNSKVLLEEILQQAREDMYEGDVKVRLRFGHDTTIMKLLSLLGLGQWTGTTWPSSDVCMAANLCFVFAQNRPGDVLVQVRFNEHDISGWLPLDFFEKKLN